MSNKKLSVISYITLIGWLIAFVSGKENSNSLLKYHLRQSLGLTIISAIFNVIVIVLTSILPFLSIIAYFSIVFFGLMIIGMINASNEIEKPLPLIGKLFESKFAFLN